jgi:hypothetical protein
MYSEQINCSPVLVSWVSPCCSPQEMQSRANLKHEGMIVSSRCRMIWRADETMRVVQPHNAHAQHAHAKICNQSLT